MEPPTVDSVDSRIKEPMKIIHKEQDIITAFAINQVRKVEGWSLLYKCMCIMIVFQHVTVVLMISN